MDTTVYYSKINLLSHINNVYRGEIEINDILSVLGDKISNGIKYNRFEKRMINGEEVVYEATYYLDSIQKLGEKYDNAIVGYMYKESPVFLQTIDEESQRLVKYPENNIEAITFYFDVKNEIVVFHRTRRFGYQEFNTAFESIINEAVSKENIIFSVDIMKKALNLDEIKAELKKLGILESIEIEIKAPNANTKVLDSIKKNGEEELEKYKEGNITERKTSLISKSKDGLNLESRVVNEELDKIGSIHTLIEADEAIKNGYVHVNAESKNGMKYTTHDQRPLTNSYEGDNKSITNFIEVGMQLIRSILY